MAVNKDKRGLTLKYKMFCENYVSNGGNAVQAWIATGSTAKKASISANIDKVLKKPEIKLYIEELEKIAQDKVRLIVTDNAITKDVLVKHLYVIVCDDDSANRDKISAIDKISDIMGYKAPKESRQIELKFTQAMETVEQLTREIKERERGY